MKKREFYRRSLPHFQQPGQAYFVTWNLQDAAPPKALIRYKNSLKELKVQIDLCKKQKADKSVVDSLIKKYYITRRKYAKAYDDILHRCNQSSIDLSKTTNTSVIKEALHFWDNKKLDNLSYAIMKNHIHWVFKIFEKDEHNEPVFLQDILHSVKRFTGNRINKSEQNRGALWQKESFDVTIRNDKHLQNAINYTLNNPVAAGYVPNWKDWHGCWKSPDLEW